MHRPIAITIVSIIMLFCAALSAYYCVQSFFGAHPEDLGLSASSYVIAFIGTLGTGIGLWLMQRWAFIFYAIVWLLGTAFLLVSGYQFRWQSIIGLALMTVLYLCFRRRFGANQSSKRTREKPRAA